ncbi:hypothetical protein SNE40_013985 [Patella caerulea]|uniref:Uncharacterized protein n=1 Tax=Patella caerulea TaxID=87958 RepID=A0AAN8JKD3_PATCE
MAKMMSTRDPYPFPRMQNDDNFYGTGVSQVEPYSEPTHVAQTADPWNRLNSKHTLCSSRREIYHHDPAAPRDSLDFILKTQYDQHAELFKNRNETLLQPETLNLDHGRTLKNREVIIPKEPLRMNHPLSVTEQNKRDSIHSVKNAIESHHSQQTNKGYSRKPDGGFFNI